MTQRDRDRLIALKKAKKRLINAQRQASLEIGPNLERYRPLIVGKVKKRRRLRRWSTGGGANDPNS